MGYIVLQPCQTAWRVKNSGSATLLSSFCRFGSKTEASPVKELKLHQARGLNS